MEGCPVEKAVLPTLGIVSVETEARKLSLPLADAAAMRHATLGHTPYSTAGCTNTRDSGRVALPRRSCMNYTNRAVCRPGHQG